MKFSIFYFIFSFLSYLPISLSKGLRGSLKFLKILGMLMNYEILRFYKLKKIRGVFEKFKISMCPSIV